MKKRDEDIKIEFKEDNSPEFDSPRTKSLIEKDDEQPKAFA